MPALTIPFRSVIRITALITCTILCGYSLGTPQTGSAGVLLKGQVVDTTGSPVPRATVTVKSPLKGRLGTATDLYGRFRFHLPDSPTSQVDIRATSVGFLPTDTVLVLSKDTQAVIIVCRPELVETGRVEVTGYRSQPNQAVRLNHRTLSTAAMKTLIPSDPLAAIRYPQLAHFGLNFASQLRIDGSIPRYYLNGVSIGADPTHFGAFAFIPTPAVEQIDFSPQGTNALYSTPSVIDLKTVGHTTAGHRGEITASIIDLTGSYLVASNRAFVGATLRQSLIDQLSDAINFGSSRHEIPAPNITDLLLCSGYRLSKTLHLTTDFYHVHDDLPYNFEQKSGATGVVKTRQTSTEDHLSLGLSYRDDKWHGLLAAGIRSGKRSFVAVTDDPSPGDFKVDFQETYRYLQANGELGYNGRLVDITVGNQFESMPSQTLHLRQYSWNLLSPFAHSDNLDFFQSTINHYYGVYNGSVDGYTNSAFLTAQVHLGRFEIENGIRHEYFSCLGRKSELATRHGLHLSLGERKSIELFCGRFFESPITSTSDAYQVPARIFLSALLPIETRLGTASVRWGVMTVALFKKEIRNRPVLAPDYNHYNKRVDYVGGYYITSDPEFLGVHSINRSTFSGVSISVDAPGFPSPRIDLYASYAYSKARTNFYGVTMPHELDAPHRLLLQGSILVSSKMRCSAELAVHSGYPYSPYRRVDFYPTMYPPTEDEYMADLKNQNSARFSPNASLNLHVSYRVGRGDFFVSIVNATNRANEMIGSDQDFIYDSGLIPNIGFQYRF
ncbi:MAG: carboxypeptidase-like regulatory domain-containing protein [Candidatus Zixiibacteriota bacterium]